MSRFTVFDVLPGGGDSRFTVFHVLPGDLTVHHISCVNGGWPWGGGLTVHRISFVTGGGGGVRGSPYFMC